jgi:hypothetical protein
LLTISCDSFLLFLRCAQPSPVRDPDKYLLHHPPTSSRTGRWSTAEHTLFLSALRVYFPFSSKWGLFSALIPGRVGVQCRSRFNALVRAGILDGKTACARPELVNIHTGSGNALFLRRNLRKIAPLILPDLGAARAALRESLEKSTRVPALSAVGKSCACILRGLSDSNHTAIQNASNNGDVSPIAAASIENDVVPTVSEDIKDVANVATAAARESDVCVDDEILNVIDISDVNAAPASSAAVKGAINKALRGIHLTENPYLAVDIDDDGDNVYVVTVGDEGDDGNNFELDDVEDDDDEEMMAMGTPVKGKTYVGGDSLRENLDEEDMRMIDLDEEEEMGMEMEETVEMSRCTVNSYTSSKLPRLVEDSQTPDGASKETRCALDYPTTCVSRGSRRVLAPSRASISFLLGVGDDNETSPSLGLKETTVASVYEAEPIKRITSPLATRAVESVDDVPRPNANRAAAQSVVIVTDMNNKENVAPLPLRGAIFAKPVVSSKKPPLASGLQYTRHHKRGLHAINSTDSSSDELEIGSPSKAKTSATTDWHYQSQKRRRKSFKLADAVEDKEVNFPTADYTDVTRQVLHLRKTLVLWAASCPLGGADLGHVMERKRLVEEFDSARARVLSFAPGAAKKLPIENCSRMLQACRSLSEKSGISVCGLDVSDGGNWTKNLTTQWKEFVRSYIGLYTEVDARQRQELSSLAMMSAFLF